jgi:putative ABC transport system permease protein
VVAESTADVQVVGTLRHRDSSVDAVLQLSDLRRGLWSPPLTAGAVTGDRPGVVLPTRAATDLGVEPGDTVTLRHPLRTGATSYTFTESPVEVLGVTPLPLRFLVFMDSSSLGLMGLEGTTNVVTVNRAEGVGRDEFTRTLYGLPGVGSVSSPTTTVRAVTAQLDEILGILRIVDAALVLMAALIAFNSTSINLEERAREQATMLAFGLPLRSVMGVAVAESLITGVAGTLAGIAAGRVVLHWIVTRMLPDVVPDLGVVDHLGWTTVALALALGVLAVGVAPLFSVRRLSRMDVPATLRVME